MNLKEAADAIAPYARASNYLNGLERRERDSGGEARPASRRRARVSQKERTIASAVADSASHRQQRRCRRWREVACCGWFEGSA
jgi:hypothetical protein